MKLTLQREQLLKPLQMVIGAIDSKQAMPILSNVLLQAKENRLSVTGTDLEVELVGQSLLPSMQPDSVQLTLPARKLMDICKALPDEAAIELYQEKDRVILKSNRSRFTMSTMPATDFPSVESSEANLSFSMPQAELLRLLQRTAFAMAHQDVRYYLNGMLFEFTGSLMRTVATDGHRLAMQQITLPVAQDHRLQIIVPYKAIVELSRLLKDPEQAVEISVSNHHIRLVSSDFVFTTKLIEGRFPDYQRVIPKSGNKTIVVDRDELKQALMRTSILSNEKIRGVRFECRDGCLQLLSNNPEHEAAEETIDVDYQGEPLDIAFNITYLIDVLNVMQPGPVKLALTDTNSSMRIDEPGQEDTGTFVVMPMRL